MTKNSDENVFYSSQSSLGDENRNVIYENELDFYADFIKNYIPLKKKEINHVMNECFQRIAKCQKDESKSPLQIKKEHLKILLEMKEDFYGILPEDKISIDVAFDGLKYIMFPH